MQPIQRAMLVLGGGPESPSSARRQARAVLDGWGCDEDCIDDVLLVLSELVGNAVLHAGDAQSAAILLYPDRVRIEVADRSHLAPAANRYGPEALTGRGLGLVDSLARDWGTATQEAGKLVWADVPLPGAKVVTSGPAPVSTAVERPVADVQRFLQVPVDVYLEMQQQSDALQREIDLLLIGAGEGLAPPVPDALLAACRRLREQWVNPVSAYREAVLEAAAAGRATVDLEGPALLPETAERAAEYVALIEEIERYGEAGYLFVDPPRPEVVGLRRWFAEEAAAQARGEGPSRAPTPA